MKISYAGIFCLTLITVSPVGMQAHTPEVPSVTTTTTTGTARLACLTTCRPKIALLVAGVLYGLAYIRLTTKPSPKNQVKRTWSESLWKLAGVLNITKLLTEEYRQNFDEVMIGYPLKLVDIDKEGLEGELTVTRHDKEVKVFPQGVMGLFDAYVVMSLKKIFQNIELLVKCKNYFDVFYA